MRNFDEDERELGPVEDDFAPLADFPLADATFVLLELALPDVAVLLELAGLLEVADLAELADVRTRTARAFTTCVLVEVRVFALGLLNLPEGFACARSGPAHIPSAAATNSDRVN